MVDLTAPNSVAISNKASSPPTQEYSQTTPHVNTLQDWLWLYNCKLWVHFEMQNLRYNTVTNYALCHASEIIKYRMLLDYESLNQVDD